MVNKKIRISLMIGSISLLLLTQGCSKNEISIRDDITPVVTNSPISEPELVLSSVSSIDVVTDRSYQDFFTENPYKQLSKSILESYINIDKDLYNYLFQAVIDEKTSVDISSFSVSNEQIVDTCSSLYEQAGFQLFYLYRVKWSNDYKTVNLTYKDYTSKEINEYKETFYRKMNHLLYNVAPKDFNEYQRFYSVYEYITKHSSYSNNMSDENTTTAYGILVNGMGICGGYSALANYVLNFVDIPTEYISNEPHAWNIVTLDNKRYHTDLTWGAGYEDTYFLNTILMDDEDRLAGLNNMGFGDFPIIVGYPRNNPITPNPCTYNDFKFYNNIYNNFSLDIEQGYVYYNDYKGINRVKLNGTDPEVILEAVVYNFVTYNGIIYYTDETNHLYQYEIGNIPVLIDDSMNVDYVKVENGILIYGDLYETKEEKKIDLNEFSLKRIPEDMNQVDTKMVTNEQTFQINVSFTEKMDTTILPIQQVGLVYKDRIIPIHLSWNENGTELIVRPKEILEKGMELQLYVMPGIIDINENSTIEGHMMSVLLK